MLFLAVLVPVLSNQVDAMPLGQVLLVVVVHLQQNGPHGVVTSHDLAKILVLIEVKLLGKSHDRLDHSLGAVQGFLTTDFIGQLLVGFGRGRRKKNCSCGLGLVKVNCLFKRCLNL